MTRDTKLSQKGSNDADEERLLRIGKSDDSALVVAERELETLLDAFHKSEIVDVLNVLTEEAETLILVEKDIVPAEGAYELVSFFKPSPRFNDLLATLRARKRK